MAGSPSGLSCGQSLGVKKSQIRHFAGAQTIIDTCRGRTQRIFVQVAFSKRLDKTFLQTEKDACHASNGCFVAGCCRATCKHKHLMLLFGDTEAFSGFLAGTLAWGLGSAERVITTLGGGRTNPKSSHDVSLMQLASGHACNRACAVAAAILDVSLLLCHKRLSHYSDMPMCTMTKLLFAGLMGRVLGNDLGNTADAMAEP